MLSQLPYRYRRLRCEPAAPATDAGRVRTVADADGRVPVSDFSNVATPVDFSLEAFEETMRILLQPYTPPRPQLIVSPEMKARIDADPVLQEAVRIVLGNP